MGAGFDEDRALHLAGVLAPMRLTRVVDVGANPVHETPYAGLLSAGRCEVWGFEPHPDAYAALVAMDRPNEHCLPYAIGIEGKGELRICKQAAFSSVLEPDTRTIEALGRFAGAASVVARKSIMTRSLDLVDEVPSFDLLKIDIQGGEAAAFEGARTKLGKALVVISEAAFTPIYVDQPMADVQMAMLRTMGFDFHKFLETHEFGFSTALSARMRRRKYRSQLIDADAVFVRALFALATLEDEPLKHLAVLADGVFDSQDVAVAAMDVLVGRGSITSEAAESYVDLLPHTEPRAEAKLVS